MTTRLLALSLGGAALLGFCVYVFYVPEPRTTLVAPAIGETPNAASNLAPTQAPRYFFDVEDHSREEISAVLQRAKDTYDNLPTELQKGVEIVMVVHGPDVEFFATENYAENKALVDLAASLDAFGLVDLKICLTAARASGFGNDKFPAFIELVPYGPAEISRLRTNGSVQL